MKIGGGDNTLFYRLSSETNCLASSYLWCVESMQTGRWRCEFGGPFDDANGAASGTGTGVNRLFNADFKEFNCRFASLRFGFGFARLLCIRY